MRFVGDLTVSYADTAHTTRNNLLIAIIPVLQHYPCTVLYCIWYFTYGITCHVRRDTHMVYVLSYIIGDTQRTICSAPYACFASYRSFVISLYHAAVTLPRFFYHASSPRLASAHRQGHTSRQQVLYRGADVGYVLKAFTK